MISIISYDFERDLIFLLLCFGGIISRGESESNILE